MVDRRIFLSGVAAAAVLAIAGRKWFTEPALAAAEKETFEVQKTDDEWRKELTPEQFNILRKEGTEYPYSSPLNKEKRKGIFACVACSLPLFSSETKFESGTGWPSFYQPLPNAVGEKVDTTMFMKRTEVHCRRCGGHMGHVFNDGPKPTGLRYCMNGVSLKFDAAQASAPS